MRYLAFFYRAFFYFLLLGFGKLGMCQQVCPKIESILVNACAPPNREAEFEMVRLKIGNQPVRLDNNMFVIWPNNRWQGLCQNAQTVALISEINATIRGCGYVQEPKNYTLPPRAQVLLIGSSNFDLSRYPNVFAELQDTLFLIFQCPGNSASGHFANSGSSRPRELAIRFLSENCELTASYVPDSLKGIDGERVDFLPNGGKRYYNPGCEVLTPQYETPLVLPSGQQTLCQGESLALRLANSPTIGGRFFWLRNEEIIIDSVETVFWARQPGIYRVGFAYPGRCKVVLSEPVELKWRPIILPKAEIKISEGQRRCIGDTLLLVASGGRIIRWLYENETLPVAAPAIRVTRSGKYSAIIEADTFCAGRDTASLRVEFFPKPQAQLLPAQDTTLCASDSLRLEAKGGSVIEWLQNSLPLAASINPIYVREAGFYQAVIEGNNGCTARDTSAAVTLKLEYPPSAFSLGKDTLLRQGESLVLRVPTTDNNWVWEPGGETTAFLTVTRAGKYILKIYNNCGETKDTLLVTYKEEEAIADVFIPNILTPNQDGINDEFGVEFSIAPVFFRLSIFDRWGKAVFQSQSPSERWKALDCASGVYVYVLEYELPNFPRAQRKGSLTLLR
jgi:gliding motility-associated-like protein